MAELLYCRLFLLTLHCVEPLINVLLQMYNVPSLGSQIDKTN